MTAHAVTRLSYECTIHLSCELLQRKVQVSSAGKNKENLVASDLQDLGSHLFSTRVYVIVMFSPTCLEECRAERP